MDISVDMRPLTQGIDPKGSHSMRHYMREGQGSYKMLTIIFFELNRNCNVNSFRREIVPVQICLHKKMIADEQQFIAEGG